MNDQALKLKARAAVRRAVMTGKLVRPSRCEECGGVPSLMADGRPSIQGHHYLGYERALDVQWLCPKCHVTHDLRPSGVENGRAKLAPSFVAEIRARHQVGRTGGGRWLGKSRNSARGLAREFGLSDRTIRRIIQNEIWPAAALKGEG